MASESWLNPSVLYRLRLRDALTHEVRTSLVGAYHGQTTVRVLAVNVICALLMAGLLWPTAPKHLLAVWVLSVLALTVISGTVNVAYFTARDADLHPDRWAAGFVLVALGNGMAWGAAGIVFYGPATPEVRSIIVVGLACMAAGAAASKTAILGAGLAFNLPTLAPLFVLFLLQDTGEGRALAIITAAYLLGLTIFSAASNGVFLKAVQLARLNEELSERQLRSDAYFRSAVENVAEFVAVVSTEGTILFHTSSSATLLRWPSDNMTGRLFTDFVHPGDAAGLRADLDFLVTDRDAAISRDVRMRKQRGGWLRLKLKARTLPESFHGGAAVVLSASQLSDHWHFEAALRNTEGRVQEKSHPDPDRTGLQDGLADVDAEVANVRRLSAGGV